jgi:hypothetical protein
VTEREIGAILEGLSSQGRVIDRLEAKLDVMNSAFLAHPVQCKLELEKKFVSNERFKPVEDAYQFVNRKVWSIGLAVGTTAVLIIIVLGNKLGILKSL